MHSFNKLGLNDKIERVCMPVMRGLVMCIWFVQCFSFYFGQEFNLTLICDPVDGSNEPTPELNDPLLLDAVCWSL